MKNIPLNSLVELTPEYHEWIKRESEGQESLVLNELRKTKRFFYLGDVPNVADTCLLASSITGIVISINKGLVHEV